MRKIYVTIILLCALAVSVLAKATLCMRVYLFFTFCVCKAFFANNISLLFTQIFNSAKVPKANFVVAFYTSSTVQHNLFYPTSPNTDYVFFINK